MQSDLPDMAGSQNKNGLTTVKHLICMVGLPARGKTFMSLKLARYLNWIGVRSKVFNVGMYRRKVIKQYKFRDFLMAKEAIEMRQRVADIALEEALDFIKGGEGDVAVLDSTNVTLEGRRVIHDRVVEGNSGLACLFIESYCDKPELVMANIAKVKVQLPDYEGVDQEEATQDFMQTIERYKEQYVPMSKEHEADLCYIKIINAGEKLVFNSPHCSLDTRIGYWLTNIHITPRTIYLTSSSHGCNGIDHSNMLLQHMKELEGALCVWSSQEPTAVHLATGIPAPQKRWKALDCMRVCEDKLSCARGESFENVISRLEPLILELERHEQNILIVADETILRCLLGYFMGASHSQLPHLEVPLHTLIKISPDSYGCEIKHFPLELHLSRVINHQSEVAFSPKILPNDMNEPA